MNTIDIEVIYTLTDDAYRMQVAAATGPCPRERTAVISVGSLTREARLALLDAPDRRHGVCAAWDHASVRVEEQYSLAPDAAAVSVILQVHAARAREARAAVAIGAATRSIELWARETERTAAVDALLTAWELDHAAARAAGLPSAGILTAPPSIGRIDGDGDHCPSACRPRLLALRDAIRVEDAAAGAREIAERLRAQQAALATWLPHAPPHVQRAHAEGRPIQSAAHQILATTIENVALETLAKIRRRLSVHGVAATYGDAAPFAGVPSERSYALLDALASAVPTLRDQLAVVPDLVVEVGPLARHDVAPSGSAVWRLGVELKLTSPLASESYVMLVDAPPVTEDEEGGADD